MHDTATVPDGAAVAPTAKHPPQRLVAVLVTVGSLLVVSLLVLTTSRAAFTDTTENRGNSWATGTVVLNDDAAGAMFSATGLVPGDVVTQTITVTNDSEAASVDVDLYAENLAQEEGRELAPHLNLTITAEDDELVFDGTVAEFAEDHTSTDDGADPWSGVEPGETRSYEFVVELHVDTPNTLQDTEASVDFVWEASSNSAS